MSIDARVSGLGREGDEWFITLEDRPPSKPGENAGCSGQKRLRFEGNPPPWIVRLIGADIWGGAGFLMYKEQEIATRKGYTSLVWTATNLHGLGPAALPPPPEKPPPSHSAVYAAALYPELVTIFRKHGYALAVHGSLRRDFDLIAVPWVKDVSEPSVVVAEIEREFTVRHLGGIGDKEHGRKAWTISVGHGVCSLDLSFMPVVGTHPAEEVVELKPAMGDIMDVCHNIEAVFGQLSKEETEPCCECGGDYPRADLMAGHVFCADCRKNEEARKAKPVKCINPGPPPPWGTPEKGDDTEKTSG